MYTRTDMNFLKTLKKAQGGDSGDEIPQTESELFSTRGDYGLKFLTDLYDASFELVTPAPLFLQVSQKVTIP